MSWFAWYFVISILCGIAMCTNTPLIGILTIPCVSEDWYCPANMTYDANATSFMYSSYVKWIEGGGGRVIPIQADLDLISARNLLSKLNGVVFTGGAASFNISTSIYFQQVANIMDYLLEYSTKNRGKAIPLWATCLGFEAVISYISNDLSIMKSGYNSEDVPASINFTSEAKSSRMFNSSSMDQGYSNSVYYKLNTENITMNFHQNGFDPSVFQTNKYLNGNLSLLGNSVDLNNKWFASLIESKNAYNSFSDIYGSQFHPEKPQYVFDAINGNNNIVHTLDAIYANQYFVEFFVNECRLRNENIMDTTEYNNKVIYNYQPFWFQNGTTHPEQLYWFPYPN